jgi:ribosomal-protein-alanine N-acetyltransferase
VLPNYWGRGIMPEAGKAVIKFSFKQLNMHRIEAFVKTLILNCKRGLEKLMFAFKCTIRECELKHKE